MPDGSTFTPAKPSFRSWLRSEGYEPKGWVGSRTLRLFLHDMDVFQCEGCSRWLQAQARSRGCDDLLCEDCDDPSYRAPSAGYLRRHERTWRV